MSIPISWSRSARSTGSVKKIDGDGDDRRGTAMGMRMTPMLAWTAAGLLAFGGAEPAAAQSTPPDRMQIVVKDNDGGYHATKNYAGVRDRVIKARLLERLRDFLSPVRLPRSVGVQAAECDGGANQGPFYRNRDR